MILHEQVLKLGHGAIGVLEDGAFIGLVSLRELSLTNCKLREMLPLGPVKDSLETLELRRNSLSSTANDYFNNFRKLHTINLGNNSLEVAPNVSALNDQLKTLQIPFNKITVLDSLISAVYPQLFRLDVAGNRLTQLTRSTVYPKKYAHGFCFAVLCCGYTLTDFPYPSGLLHWHCDNLTIVPMPAKQPWWIRINASCEFIMNDCITTTKQSTTKPCAYFLGYTVCSTSGQLCGICIYRIIHWKP